MPRPTNQDFQNCWTIFGIWNSSVSFLLNHDGGFLCWTDAKTRPCKGPTHCLHPLTCLPWLTEFRTHDLWCTTMNTGKQEWQKSHKEQCKMFSQVCHLEQSNGTHCCSDHHWLSLLQAKIVPMLCSFWHEHLSCAVIQLCHSACNFQRVLQWSVVPVEQGRPG